MGGSKLLVPGNVYHIYTHANGNENIFRCPENYRYFLEKYAYHLHPVVDTFAYCLMPNHLHLMVRLKNEEELRQHQIARKLTSSTEITKGNYQAGKIVSQCFSNLFNSYTKAYNKRYSRRGSLFIPNFQRKEIGNDAYFTALIRYIHHNPIHHQFVKDLKDWPYSSYHAYVEDVDSPINKQEVLNWFGGKSGFKLHHEEPIKINKDYFN